MSVARTYLRALHRRFRLLGAWPPNRRVEVGEIGVIQDGVFQRRSTLHHLGMPFSASSTGQGADMDYSEGAELTFAPDGDAQLAGSALLAGAPRVGLRIRLTSAGSFLFSAIGAVEWRIDDALSVERRVLAAVKQDRWDPSWIIVDRVVQVASLTVLISESEGAELGLAAAGALGRGGFSLADGRLGLQVAEAQGECLRFLSVQGQTPLYQGLQLNRRLLGRDRLENLPVPFVEDEPDLVPVEWDEADASGTETNGPADL